MASFSYFVKHDPTLIGYDKWIASVLKLELVWWFLPAKKALVLKIKPLRQNSPFISRSNPLKPPKTLFLKALIPSSSPFHQWHGSCH